MDGMVSQRCPGITIVRPRLHDGTQQSRALFRRWAKVHMRDILSLPHDDEELGGALKALRYTQVTADSGEEYFYNMVLGDTKLMKHMDSFQNPPRRLDLENTRALCGGEEPVRRDGDENVETEPIAVSIVLAVAGVFDEMPSRDLYTRPLDIGQGAARYHLIITTAGLDRTANNLWMSYQDLPKAFVGLQRASMFMVFGPHVCSLVNT